MIKKSGVWTKSSFSNGNGGNNCVEVAVTGIPTVFVRSTRDPRIMLTFTENEWKAFLAGVKAGEFDV